MEIMEVIKEGRKISKGYNVMDIYDRYRYKFGMYDGKQTNLEFFKKLK